MHQYPDWIIDMLGEAPQNIIELITVGIQNAHGRGRSAQDASGLRQLNPYGNTLWLAVHDELSTSIGALPGCSTFKPDGASYSVPVVGETAIYAYRQGSKLRGDLQAAALEPRAVRDALVALSNRVTAEDTLDFDSLTAGDASWATPELRASRSAPRRTLLVPFIDNADAGLIAAGLGEGRLQSGGTIDWAHFVDLDLNLYRSAPRAVVEVAEERRFDNAVIPEPDMMPRRQRTTTPDEEGEKACQQSDEAKKGTNE